MSPSIRIDEEVFQVLQRHAQPLVDSPNSVLRRLLGLEGKAKPSLSVGADSSAPVESGKRRPKRGKHQGTPDRAKGPAGEGSRAKPGALLRLEEYMEPLLSVLAERGGTAPAREVIDAVGDRLEGRLQATDMEKLSSGAVRWENRTQFARLRLVEQGLLAKDSPRGVWSLTEFGRARADRGRVNREVM